MDDSTAIIAYDCISPLGDSFESTWRAATGNASGIRQLDRFRPADSRLRGVGKIQYAGQLPLSFENLAGSRDSLTKWPEPAYHATRLVARRLLGRIGMTAGDHEPQRLAVI